MSSIEIKHFTNIICRLAGSLRDFEFMCVDFLDASMDIKEAIKKMQINNKTTSEILIDCAEMEKVKMENEDMKALLNDYHRGVELMMAAYRERALNSLIEEKQKMPTINEIYDSNLVDIIIKQSDKIYQMLTVMRQSAGADEKAENLITQQMVYLRKENEVLNELYKISKEYGTAKKEIRLNELDLKEIGIQTDDIEQDIKDFDELFSFDTQYEDNVFNINEIDNIYNDYNDDYTEEEAEDDEDNITVIDFIMDDKDTE